MSGHIKTAFSRLALDLGAVCANYRTIARRVAPAACGAVIKADAYGLGARDVAPALYDEGCRVFFVAQFSEALNVTDVLGEDAEIVILNGLEPGAEAACAAHEFLPVLNADSQVARWRDLARAKGTPLPAVLQVDSGMSRLGLDASAAASLAADPAFAREVPLRLIITHLACADEPGHAANAEQSARFRAIRRLFPTVQASIANSGGAFLSSAFHCDLVRPGIALYGVQPHSSSILMHPVVRLDARILQIREIEAGIRVGYGLDYAAPSRRRIATLGIGYADGWPRCLGGTGTGTGSAWHAGQRLPIVGRVSMDSMTIDLTALAPDALAEGDFVELLGPSQSLADVARDAGTIAYEILTRLGTRSERIFAGHQTAAAAALETVQ
ncbi:alanine racemase [Sphingosinicella microcystinivorans]|uniref:Alanine racemase n=1 Tax=Sphingosinicella microcystinivorans TaxID=335406 RepID=A0AAD1D590_SPHMI|nr:alanine racemase [Sphingosinicella microcystinivorans]RKS91152.1 alanine racemase [Sphingosinicella microcystinivorans]BBE34116.1 alanine racemase [Sphingosinicella microcystinivorans]